MNREQSKEDVFEEYRELIAQVDRIFDQVKEMHGNLVNCKVGCDDCCYAFFELTPIEAVYIRDRFAKCSDPEKKEAILERAREAHQKYLKLAERLVRASALGPEEKHVEMDAAARERIACPLLNDRRQCDLYDDRPVTCRLYGIPTRIDNAARTCGLSGFKKGGAYPTANLDLLQEKLIALSEKLMALDRAERWVELDRMISLPTALTADIDEAGFGEEEKKG